jgi:alpha-ketoglutarate-dependent taurine dioxygenase
MGQSVRTLGTRLGILPSEALADRTKLLQVAQALSCHGVISLEPEQGVTPSALADFTIRLATERNKHSLLLPAAAAAAAGRLVKGVDDLADATCQNVRIGDAPRAPLAEENVALVLSNVPLSDAAAFGVDPMYLGPGRIPQTESASWRNDGGDNITITSNTTSKRRRAGVDANLAAVWHQDEQFRRLPASFTLLYCIVSPKDGCDTVYADTQTAFATLPDSLRARIRRRNNEDESSTAINSSTYRFAAHSLSTIDTEFDPASRADQETQAHPLVILDDYDNFSNEVEEHAPSLYLGSRNARVAGLDKAESLKLMDELIAHATEGPEAILYSHRHESGVLLIACNRTTLHRATPGVVASVAGRLEEARHLIRFQAEEPFPLSRLAE